MNNVKACLCCEKKEEDVKYLTTFSEGSDEYHICNTCGTEEECSEEASRMFEKEVEEETEELQLE